MNFFSQEFTFTVNGVALVTGGAVILAGILALFLVIVSLIKRIRSLQTPRYGFLGKPLYTLSTIALTALVIYFVSYNFSKPGNFDVKASKTITAELITNRVSESQTESTIDFKLLPSINAKLWGEAGSKFDIYWNVTGPTKFDMFELEKTAENLSGFQHIVKKGTYTLKIVVVFEDKTYTLTEERVL